MHTSSEVDDGYLGSGTAILAAIKKYGKKNFIREVLCFCKTTDEAFRNEAVFIKEYNTIVPFGYNISPKGGHTVVGGVSKETKQKISESSMGKASWSKGLTKKTDERLMKTSEAMKKNIPWSVGLTKETNKSLKQASESQKGRIPWNKGKDGCFSDETIQKMKDSHTGNICSGETRRKMSEAGAGRVASKETRDKMREANIGDKNPNYGKTGAKSTQSKSILQCSKDGDFIKEWAGAVEAERELGFCGGNIGYCTTGRGKTAYGFIWKFKEIK